MIFKSKGYDYIVMVPHLYINFTFKLVDTNTVFNVRSIISYFNQSYIKLMSILIYVCI